MKCQSPLFWEGPWSPPRGCEQRSWLRGDQTGLWGDASLATLAALALCWGPSPVAVFSEHLLRARPHAACWAQEGGKSGSRHHALSSRPSPSSSQLLA